MKTVEVWLEHPTMSLNRTFTYWTDAANIAKGMRVQVPLGKQNVVGFVHEVREIALTAEEYSRQCGYEVKKIAAVMDEEPLLNDELYDLGLWMAHETVSPTISCFQAMLPNKIKPRSGRQAVVQQAFVKIKDETKVKTE